MDEKGLSVADALALSRDNDDNGNIFGGGSGAWWVIILILFLGMFGRGFGGYGNGGDGVNTVVVPTGGWGSGWGGTSCCAPATQ